MSEDANKRITRYPSERPDWRETCRPIQGPLFEPEETLADENETIEHDTGLVDRPYEPAQPRQPGWIYVASRHDVDELLRVAVSERVVPGRTDADPITLFAQDLGIPASETLRYCAFVLDTYGTLAHVRRVLNKFDSGSLRYRCAGAVAAAAIESAGVSIQLRRTNFEGRQHRRVDNSSPRYADETTANLMHGRRGGRSARHAELNLMLEDARDCLDLASDLLNDSPETRRLITGGLTQNPEPGRTNSSERGLTRLSDDSLQKIETWVMRREALQFLRKRKNDLGFALLLATATGAAISVTGARLVLEQSTVSERALIAGVGALVLAIVRYALFQRRYRSSIALWKAILKPNASS